jgi:hypothetical protein
VEGAAHARRRLGRQRGELVEGGLHGPQGTARTAGS